MSELHRPLVEPELSSPDVSSRAQRAGGVRAVVLFIVILAAYVIQSQLTQFLQMDLGYSQPYLIFYIAHSSFIFIYPVHVLYLQVTTGTPYSQYSAAISAAITEHLSSSVSTGFPTGRLLALVLGLTLGSTMTALLWYISVAFSPVSDVTALFNTNAFWAYILSVLCSADLEDRRWEARKLFAVIAACAGVFAVVYGSAHTTNSEASSIFGLSTTTSGPLVLLGEFLALTASVTYALYQVFYKRFAVLPPSISAPPFPSPSSSPLQSIVYRRLPPNDVEDNEADQESSNKDDESPLASKLPWALYPNFLTSLIGFATLTIFWVPIPVVHYLSDPADSPLTSILPPDTKAWICIALMSFTGLIFNGGFMILLSIWGPVIVSVGNLLTIVLVQISNALFGDGMRTITLWSLLGSGMIVGAFCVLATDVVQVQG